MKHFAVVGNPIKQSKSPIIHHHFAAQFNIDLQYDKLLSTEQDFSELVNSFFQNGGIGLNITAPFKELAFALADTVTERANMANAANTLYKINGNLIADTTDGAGLVADIKHQGIELKGKKVLLLGAGGAAKGSVLSILSEQVKQLDIANRSVEKAKQIAENVNQANCRGIAFSELESDYQVIINSTSCSLSNEVPNIAPNVLINTEYAYDMSYKKEQTSFNHWVEQHSNAVTSDGLGMLIEQAAESFRIWHNLTPNTKELRQILREEE